MLKLNIHKIYSYYMQSLKVGSAQESGEEAQTSERPSEQTRCSSTSTDASWGGLGIWSGALLKHLSGKVVQPGGDQEGLHLRSSPATPERSPGGAEGGVRLALTQRFRRILSKISPMTTQHALLHRCFPWVHHFSRLFSLSHWPLVSYSWIAPESTGVITCTTQHVCW